MITTDPAQVAKILSHWSKVLNGDSIDRRKIRCPTSKRNQTKKGFNRIPTRHQIRLPFMSRSNGDNPREAEADIKKKAHGRVPRLHMHERRDHRSQ